MNDSLKEAIDLLEDLILANPEDLEVRIKLIEALFKSGCYPEAVQNLLRAIEIQPEWTQLHFELIITLSKIGDESNLREAARIVAENDPCNDLVWYIIGMCYQILGDQDEAAVSFRKGLTINPNNPVLYNNLGTTLKGLKGDSACIECQQKAIALSSTFAEPHYILGVLYMKVGKQKEAKQHFTAFLALGKPYLGNYLREAQYSLSILDLKRPVL